MKAPSGPVYSVTYSLLARIKYRLMLLLFKLGLGLAKYFRLLDSKDPRDKPTYVKSYAPLPSHQARIFIPRTYTSGDAPLPLIIDIHGGGFCIGAPVVDDKDNAILCHDHGYCIVSIPYRLGPEVKHPVAVYDVGSMISAVLADESLPIDRSRVVLAGYSAGANLALSVTQLPLVRGKIKAVVAYYPATNGTLSIAERQQRQKPHPTRRDNLLPMMRMFHYGYLTPGTDKADPLYSPIFAKREDLPEKIFIIGCEYDMLMGEAQDMAEDLASSESKAKTNLDGDRVGWTTGNIQWELIEGTQHGFNQVPKRGRDLEIARQKTIAMHAGVAAWLKTNVLAS